MLAYLASSPHLLHAAVLATKSTPTTTVAKAKAGASSYLIIVLLVLVVGYFAFMRPRSRARLQQQQQAQARTLEVGDEVATTAGIVGRVRRIADDRVELEIAHGMRIQVLRQNIGRPLQSSGFGGSGFDSSGSFDVTGRDGLDSGNGSGGEYVEDPAWDDSGSSWSGNDASALGPGGERDEEAESASGVAGAGSAGAGGGGSSSGTRPAGSRAARSRPRRPRPAGTATSDSRPPGWSLTSDDAGDDGTAGGSSAAGTSS
ncbi:MAG TPA: preprotein translocase subunit YajC [Acidimicrobiales bacterium]|nr:preprotein translocase subunit YajC [Acidimicrobiales bacterium]